MTQNEVIQYAHCLIYLIEQSKITVHQKCNLKAIIYGYITLAQEDPEHIEKLLTNISKVQERLKWKKT